MKVCLVGSSGGHLTHLYMLKPFWESKDHFWVTFDKEDARSILKDEKMYIDLSVIGAGIVEIPQYGDLKMRLSQKYNECPLK